MKNLLLISFIIIIPATLLGQANIYHPFPDSNAMWTDRIYEPFCNMTYECSINQYTISGDTLINGTLYKKLTKSGYLISQNYQYTFYSEYAGAYRQEINKKRIYFFPPYGYPQIDTLLYNFDLHIGSSLPLTYIYPVDWCNSIVDSVDSVAVGDFYHKRFHISTQGTPPLQPVWLIEGIGCTNGLFTGFCRGWEGWQDLTCFIQNDTMSYPTPPNSDCSLITSIPSSQNSPSMTIYPNPVQSYFIIEFSEAQKNAQILIMNLTGQIIQRHSVTSKKVSIDLGNLASGIYLMRFINEKKSETKKLVKE